MVGSLLRETNQTMKKCLRISPRMAWLVRIFPTSDVFHEWSTHSNPNIPKLLLRCYLPLTGLIKWSESAVIRGLSYSQILLLIFELYTTTVDNICFCTMKHTVKKADDRENINSKSSTKGLEQAALCLPDVNEIYIK